MRVKTLKMWVENVVICINNLFVNLGYFEVHILFLQLYAFNKFDCYTIYDAYKKTFYNLIL